MKWTVFDDIPKSAILLTLVTAMVTSSISRSTFGNTMSQLSGDKVMQDKGVTVQPVAVDLQQNSIEAPGAHFQPRLKRVIYGQIMALDKRHVHAYKALAFTVIISHSHQCSWRTFEEFYQAYPQVITYTSEPIAYCMLRYQNTRCMGSLITERIVQTNCHCLATFWNFKNNGSSLDPIAKGVWEDHLIVIRPTKLREGKWTNSQKIKTFSQWINEEVLFSRKFYVHQKCHHFANKVYSHDFGLIVLSEPTMKIPNFVLDKNMDRPQYPVIFDWMMAPLYTSEWIDRIWRYVTSRQLACLFVGFGSTEWASGVYKGHPEVIKYTWRAVESYTWCVEYFKKYFHINPNDATFWRNLGSKYKEDASWTCSVILGRFRGIPAIGDDGGPVTCDNMYYGVFAGAFPPDTVQSNVSIQHSIAYSKYENAVEYRTALIEMASRDSDVFTGLRVKPHNKKGKAKIRATSGGFAGKENALAKSGVQTNNPFTDQSFTTLTISLLIELFMY